MVVAADLAPPVGYSPWWAISAALAVAVVVLWYAGALWLTRDEGGAVRGPASLSLGVREAALADVDGLIDRWTHGTVPSRVAYEQLSGIVRRFAAAATGAPVETMTLTDLQNSDLPYLPELMAVIYPGQFGPLDTTDPMPTLSAGRQVISVWR